MTNEHEHPAEGPEQEITSETPEFAEAMAERTVQPGDRPKATMPESETPLNDEEDESGDEAIGAEDQSAEREAPKLERLQKILAQAGVASRRHAEELITQGRVQVNGQTVTVLGSKADPQRDHIRVDGKLLHGAERQRYFVLNKPRGYVTTVKDPEGRPTVMEFFAKMVERLYPVGRLDYQSEGLLLVTNDGELANQLTRAASGVEKTYLVKVSGQPDQGQLERLRTGVAIDKGRPQEGKVHTAPAQIRQIRKGENPWFEVVLIEGRNRELRKMFEEIGHHVEKIRRVGYGPLILDVEPGKIRELDTREVDALRLTAEGKLKPRRPKASLMLPKDAGKPAEERDAKPKRFGRKPAGPVGERRERGFDARDRRGAEDRPKFGGPKFGGPGSGGPRFGGQKSGRGFDGPKSGGLGFSGQAFGDKGFGDKAKSGGRSGERPDRKGPSDRPSRPFRPSGDRQGRVEEGPSGREQRRPFSPGGRSYAPDARKAKPEGRSGEDRGGRGAQRPDRGGERGGERGGFNRRPEGSGNRSKFGRPDAPRRENRGPQRGEFSRRPSIEIQAEGPGPEQKQFGGERRPPREDTRPGSSPRRDGASRPGGASRGKTQQEGSARPQGRPQAPSRPYRPGSRGPGGPKTGGRDAGTSNRGGKRTDRGPAKRTFGARPEGGERSAGGAQRGSSSGAERSGAKRNFGGGAKRGAPSRAGRSGGKRTFGAKRGPSRPGGKRQK